MFSLHCLTASLHEVHFTCNAVATSLRTLFPLHCLTASLHEVHFTCNKVATSLLLRRVFIFYVERYKKCVIDSILYDKKVKLKFERVIKVAKSKKISKKDIEKFAKKVIVRYTDSIVESVFSKIKGDPELNKEYFELCGFGDMVEEIPVKPAKEEKAVKKVPAIKKTKDVKKAVATKKPKAVKKMTEKKIK